MTSRPAPDLAILMVNPDSIREEDLVFSPLGHASFLANARVRVSDHFALSITYNLTSGSWYAGSRGSYEVGVLVFDKHDNEPGTDLTDIHVDGHTNNIWSRCDIDRIRELARKAQSLVYAGAIHVYAKRAPSQSETWAVRFCAAAGRDIRRKTSYAMQMFGEHNVRLVSPQGTAPIYTIGKQSIYEPYIDKDAFAGKAKGGSVWQYRHEADQARFALHDPDYSVYQVHAPWGIATRPDEIAEDSKKQHELLIAAPLSRCPKEDSLSEKSA